MYLVRVMGWNGTGPFRIWALFSCLVDLGIETHSFSRTEYSYVERTYTSNIEEPRGTASCSHLPTDALALRTLSLTVVAPPPSSLPRPTVLLSRLSLNLTALPFRLSLWPVALGQQSPHPCRLIPVGGATPQI